MVPAVPIRFGPSPSAQFWLLFQVHGRTSEGERRAVTLSFLHTLVLSLLDHILPHPFPVSPVVSRTNSCLSFEFTPRSHLLLARKNEPLPSFFFEKLCIIPAAGSASVLELACMSHVHGLPSSSALRLVVSACSPYFHVMSVAAIYHDVNLVFGLPRNMFLRPCRPSGSTCTSTAPDLHTW